MCLERWQSWQSSPALNRQTLIVCTYRTVRKYKLFSSFREMRCCLSLKRLPALEDGEVVYRANRWRREGLWRIVSNIRTYFPFSGRKSVIARTVVVLFAVRTWRACGSDVRRVFAVTHRADQVGGDWADTLPITPIQKLRTFTQINSQDKIKLILPDLTTFLPNCGMIQKNKSNRRESKLVGL